MPISVASPRNGARLAPPLRALVRGALALERARPGEIAIVLAGDEQLRELNRRWRGIDRATDVLSFGYDETAPAAAVRGRTRQRAAAPPRARDTGAAAVSGDLVISLDRVRVQAKRYRVTPGRELARLAVHGALHLAGLDHHRAAERDHMRHQERRALRGVSAHVSTLDAALLEQPW
jgi:probable rRNA maturation factor